MGAKPQAAVLRDIPCCSHRDPGRDRVQCLGGSRVTLPRPWGTTQEMEQQGPALQRSPALGPAEHPAWEERGGS